MAKESTFYRKSKAIDGILKNDVYPPESVMYKMVAEQLMKLPVKTLEAMATILVMRVIESNRLAVDVSKILAK